MHIYKHDCRDDVAYLIFLSSWNFSELLDESEKIIVLTCFKKQLRFHIDSGQCCETLEFYNWFVSSITSINYFKCNLLRILLTRFLKVLIKNDQTFR